MLSFAGPIFGHLGLRITGENQQKKYRLSLHRSIKKMKRYLWNISPGIHLGSSKTFLNTKETSLFRCTRRWLQLCRWPNQNHILGEVERCMEGSREPPCENTQVLYLPHVQSFNSGMDLGWTKSWMKTEKDKEHDAKHQLWIFRLGCFWRRILFF